MTVLVSVGDHDTAQELVAEAFARAWASWPKVGGHPAPEAWVVRTALNAGISRWRRRRREVPVADAGSVPGVAMENHVPSGIDPVLMAGRAGWRPGVDVRVGPAQRPPDDGQPLDGLGICNAIL